MRAMLNGIATGLAVAIFWLDLGPFPIYGESAHLAPQTFGSLAGPSLPVSGSSSTAPGMGPFLLTERESRCLARTVFFEARGEPLLGELSVALVALNRVRQPAYPSDACAVIHEVAAFSWYSDGESDDPTDYPGIANRRAWVRAQRLVEALQTSRVMDPTAGADHYHAVYVSPDWAKEFPQTARIGSHLFYRRGR
ncbi:cell wall hydrolase [Thiohalorhabdus sp. Cl-TMA]|uniref:Cell wall hydrolase n=1 Tax=Thiohalorhabdus methylotrophus TaxID=3242694 RepID=A0ABV4TZ00_9GAMM